MNVAQSIVVIRTLIKNKDCVSLNMLLDRTVERVCDYLFTELFPMEEWGKIPITQFISLLDEIDYDIYRFMNFYFMENSSYCSSLDFLSEDYRNAKENGWTTAETKDNYRVSRTIRHAETVLELLTQLLEYLEANCQVRADQIEMRKCPRK
jgi:hypothetical protein